jgi:glutathione synthase/RimK-type ligase-like ATP-grasp enzyme
MILILSREGDNHITKVCEILTQASKLFFLLDQSEFPIESSFSFEFDKKESFFKFSNERDTIDLARCSAAWWRRPQKIKLHGEIISDYDTQFIHDECRHALRGLWSSMKCKWINDPYKNDIASKKVLQLEMAKRIGFSIPNTLITNSPNDANRFISQLGVGNVIFKPLSPTEKDWRETRLLKKVELDILECVKFAPVIFQEFIVSKYNLRITVINRKIFSAVILADEASYIYDIRMSENHTIEPYSLPKKVELHIHKLMNSLGLVYGAIDMIVKPDGQYIFLEINPAGQWLFIEKATNMPISEAIAIELMSSI